MFCLHFNLRRLLISLFVIFFCGQNKFTLTHIQVNGVGNNLDNNSGRCWGYEPKGTCSGNGYHIKPYCLPGHEQHVSTFYKEADFGYVSNRIRQLRPICIPNITSLDKDVPYSWLNCTDKTQMCISTNLLLDLRELHRIEIPMKYRGDVLSDGQIGGFNCALNKSLLLSLNGHKSPLQSWYEELEHYQILNKNHCDIWIERPTFIMKLDSTVNMYHHFCDFVNLYASLHLLGNFSRDVNILIWDTYSYRSNFGLVWKAFTKHPVLDLSKVTGKRVCFKKAIFPLLPRMVFGLFYNMPLVSNCHQSGLIHAFSRHVLNHLQIRGNATNNEKIRITLLSRSTHFRRVINERQLVNALQQKSKHFQIERHDFTHTTPFEDQLKVIVNTDILISMHGAGLTHMLFLPDWAGVFELYNCNDENCYKDLARLRGLRYITWSNDSLLQGAEKDENRKELHLKFQNYIFDKDEFVRLSLKLIQYVREKRSLLIQKNINLKDYTHISDTLLKKNHDEL